VLEYLSELKRWRSVEVRSKEPRSQNKSPGFLRVVFRTTKTIGAFLILQNPNVTYNQLPPYFLAASETSGRTGICILGIYGD
jgi:hypothetical protein